MVKELGPVALELIRRSGGIDIIVYYDTGHPSPWIGVAIFLDGMEEDALRWMREIETVNDVEDLLRIRSTTDTWDDFQALRSEMGV